MRDYISKEEAISLLKEIQEEDKLKSEKRNKIKEKMNTLFKNIGVLMLAGVFLIMIMVSGYFLIDYFISRKQADIEYNNAINEVFSEVESKEQIELIKETEPTITEIYTKESVLMDNYNHESLLQINQNAAGYLQIPALGLSLPVVYTDDNQYYLTHTIYDKYNANGCLFIDADNQSFLDKNCIIYGHDMKNGAMFGLLNRFISNDLIEKDEENQYIYFYNENRIYQYKIYSTHTTPAVRETGSAYQIIFEDDNDFLSFANKMQTKSFVESNYSFKGDESTLTLSTCTNDNNTRFVVQAVLIHQMDLKGNVIN